MKWLQVHRDRIIVSLLYACTLAVALYALYVVGSRVQTRAIPAGSISVSTEYSTYLVGDEIRFTIANNYNGPIYFDNHCPDTPLRIYRYENAQWTPLYSKKDASTCTVADREVKIQGMSSVSSSFNSWSDLFDRAGKYRIVAYVDYYDTLPYTDFELIDKPIVPAIPALTTTTTPTMPSDTPTSASNSNSSQSSANQTGGVAPTSDKQQTVSLNGGGSISATTSGSSITVTSVTKPSGYTSYEISGNGRSEVQITFKGSTGEMQVELTVRNGAISVKTEGGD